MQFTVQVMEFTFSHIVKKFIETSILPLIKEEIEKLLCMVSLKSLVSIEEMAEYLDKIHSNFKRHFFMYD